ncbi:endonuclease [Escherichia coli]|nr:endonuclease [Escherichia coli]NPN39293.1 endonuclease [Escherichia coli]
MANNPNPSSPLPDVFSPATRDWFLRAFKQPTAVQSRTTAALYANRSEWPTGPANADVYAVT